VDGSGCCVFFLVVFVFSLVLAVVNRICFVFIGVGCSLLLCFVFVSCLNVLFTLCNVCYLSVVSYCFTTATGLQPNCS
jgi:hypothetical protein